MSISRRGHDLGCACHVGISDVAVLPREEAACDTTVESAIEVRFANHEEMTIVASHTECLKVCYHQKSKQCILPWIFVVPFPSLVSDVPVGSRSPPMESMYSQEKNPLEKMKNHHHQKTKPPLFLHDCFLRFKKW